MGQLHDIKLPNKSYTNVETFKYMGTKVSKVVSMTKLRPD
jgi:hypothetical protein